MANQPINDPKDFNLALKLLETTDPAHADTFNPLFQRLINNDAYLNSELTKTNNKIDGIEIPVASVNNKTGAVSLTASDVGAETPSGAQSKADKAESNAKTYAQNLVSGVNVPVNSINNKTGNVVLSARDVGAETPSGAQSKANGAESRAKSYADSKVAGLVNSAPSTLNTLNELAEALGDDPNFVTTIMNELSKKINESEKGIANGVAVLDSNGNIPETNLDKSSGELERFWLQRHNMFMSIAFTINHMKNWHIGNDRR